MAFRLLRPTIITEFRCEMESYSVDRLIGETARSLQIAALIAYTTFRADQLYVCTSLSSAIRPIQALLVDIPLTEHCVL